MIDKVLEVLDDVGQVSGAPFYEEVARAISKSTYADYLVIGRLNEGSESIETVAFANNGEITTNFEYQLQGTPCQNVMFDDLVIHKHKLQELYPEDGYLVQFQAQACVGVPVLSINGNPIGIMVTFFRDELQDMDQITLTETLLKAFRNQVASEFIRFDQQKVIENEVDLREGLIRSLNHEMRTPVATLDHLAQTEAEMSKKMEWKLVRGMLRKTEVVMLVTQILTGEVEWQPRRFRATHWLERLRDTPIFGDDTPIKVNLDDTELNKILYSDLRILEHTCHLIFEGMIPFMKNSIADAQVHLGIDSIQIKFRADKSLPVCVISQLDDWKSVLSKDFSDFISPENIEFYLVRAIADVFQGSFEVLDNESEFEAHLELPCDAIQDIDEEINFRKRKVMVVDDVSMNRKILNKTLIPLGADIVEAADGQEAFSLYQEEQPDIILMDVQMPVLDGFEASKAIRQYELENNLSSCPIIAISANAERKECLNVGMDDHLLKPVRSDELSLAVHFMLEYTNYGNLK